MELWLASLASADRISSEAGFNNDGSVGRELLQAQIRWLSLEGELALFDASAKSGVLLRVTGMEGLVFAADVANLMGRGVTH